MLTKGHESKGGRGCVELKWARGVGNDCQYVAGDDLYVLRLLHCRDVLLGQDTIRNDIL